MASFLKKMGRSIRYIRINFLHATKHVTGYFLFVHIICGLLREYKHRVQFWSYRLRESPLGAGGESGNLGKVF